MHLRMGMVHRFLVTMEGKRLDYKEVEIVGLVHNEGRAEMEKI